MGECERKVGKKKKKKKKKTHQKQILLHGERCQKKHIWFEFSISFMTRKLNDIYNNVPPHEGLGFDFAGFHLLFSAHSCIRSHD